MYPWGVLTTAAMLTLAACSSPPSSMAGSSTTNPDAPSTQALTGSVEADASAEHVHNLALVGSDIYLGTHEGLFKQSPGAAMLRVSADTFDVMGLTRSQNAWFASGHPGAGMDGPSDLGLITSNDGGRTWQQVSLASEVDFHRLAASGDTLMGTSAGTGALMRSTDAGRTWTTLETSAPFDLAISPKDAQLVIATTPGGPIASRDGGKTFMTIEGAPLIALLAWDGAELYGVDPSGQVLVSSDDGATWQARGTVGSVPVAVTAQDGALALLAGGTVWHSRDGGKTFTARITGLAPH